MGLYAWIIGLIGLFFVAILFLVFSAPVQILYGVAYNLTNDTMVQTSQTQTYNIWMIMPLVFFFVIILWLVMQTQKKEYDTGYY
jgi:hypothetical protein